MEEEEKGRRGRERGKYERRSDCEGKEWKMRQRKKGERERRKSKREEIKDEE